MCFGLEERWAKRHLLCSCCRAAPSLLHPRTSGAKVVLSIDCPLLIRNHCPLCLHLFTMRKGDNKRLWLSADTKSPKQHDHDVSRAQLPSVPSAPRVVPLSTAGDMETALRDVAGIGSAKLGDTSKVMGTSFISNKPCKGLYPSRSGPRSIVYCPTLKM